GHRRGRRAGPRDDLHAPAAIRIGRGVAATARRPLMLRDIRHAWRSIVRMPILSAVVVLSLGVGIGVNTAIFSWVQAVVLRPLPGVPDAGGFHLREPRADTGSLTCVA